MALRMIEGGKGAAADPAGPADAPPPPTPDAPRALAPGAPPSPGTLPFELAVHLRGGEALVWWGSKTDLSFRAVFAVAAICAAVALLVTAFAPEFWLEPWESLWPPLAALFSPVAVVLARELLSRRSILITDATIVEITRRGAVQRLSFDGVKAVRRDLLTGGVRLDGGGGQRLRIPLELAQDARAAIASQRRGNLKKLKKSVEIDDPTAWLP